MALETATYLDALVATNPDGDDQLKQADDHMRLIKAVLKATFPTLTRPMYLEKARADLATATTPDLSTPTSNYINLTGTTTVTGFADEPAGFTRLIRANAAFQLTHHATALNLPGGANLTTAAGDHFLVVSTGTSTWDVIAYFKASGLPTVLPTIANSAEGVDGLIATATEEDIWAATAGRLAIIASHLSSASAYVTLTEAAGAIAVDWETFINGEVVIDQNTVISNPTNGIPGTIRSIWIGGNNSTDRVITFGNQFLGDVPVITDCDVDREYEIIIKCHTATHFSASAKRVKG